MIGSTGNSYSLSSSTSPILLEYLHRHLEIQKDESIEEAKESKDWQKAPSLWAAEFEIGQMKGPRQRLEFLARTLLIGKPSKKLVVLATPIYVALAEGSIGGSEINE